MTVLAAALLFAGQSAVTPVQANDFGLMCRMGGTLSPDNKLAAFPKPRILAVLVEPKGAAFAPVRTFDPTGLLNGHGISLFNAIPSRPGSYGAATGTQLSDPSLMQVIFTPRPAQNAPNQWQAAISPLKVEGKPQPVVGLCLRFDNMNEAEFQDFTSTVSRP